MMISEITGSMRDTRKDVMTGVTLGRKIVVTLGGILEVT